MSNLTKKFLSVYTHRQFFTTIRLHIWPIFDPPSSKFRCHKWMVPIMPWKLDLAKHKTCSIVRADKRGKIAKTTFLSGFCEMERGGNRVVAAVMLWWSCHPQIYHGGPACYSKLVSILPCKETLQLDFQESRAIDQWYYSPYLYSSSSGTSTSARGASLCICTVYI